MHLNNTASHTCVSRSPATQQGFTLVEIMVAVTISLLLLAGVMQIFLSSKASYNLQNGISRLHENARFASDIMARSIGIAGYNVTDAFNAANTQDNVTANVGLGFSVAAGSASDTIEVNYQAAEDCLGNLTGGATTDRFYLDGTNLMCLGSGDPDTPGILAEGVENMQILYGIETDTGNNADDIANRYVNATNVPAFADVVSVRIAILVNTVETVSGGVDNNVYTLLNAPPLGPMQDNLFRRVFTRTIVIRNRALSL